MCISKRKMWIISKSHREIFFCIPIFAIMEPKSQKKTNNKLIKLKAWLIHVHQLLFNSFVKKEFKF